MDSATLTTVITTITGVIGGIYGGMKYGKQSILQDSANSSSVARDTVEMLQVQVDHLEEVVQQKDEKLNEVMVRVSVLEDLVTQRAEVAEVHADLTETRFVIDRIAAKVGA